MKIVCPQCNYYKDVDPVSIPGEDLIVTCPKCRHRFPFIPADAGQEDAFAFFNVENETSPGLDSSRDMAGPPFEPEVEMDDIGPSPGYREIVSGVQGIRWENQDGGSFSALMSTIKEILFSPWDFYTSMPVGGGLKPPLVFGLAVGSAGMILSIFWSIFWTIVIFNYGLNGLFDEAIDYLFPFPITSIAAAAVIMVFVPLLVIIGLFFWSIFTHILLVLVLGNKSGFEATFRVLSYSLSAWIFNVIPFLGGLLAFLWGLVLEIIGLSRAHEIGLFRVIFAVLFLPVILLILAIIGLLMAIGLVPSVLFA
ncbi:MAG: YIP1 family protein [Candidatus Adiutricales bacterium]